VKISIFPLKILENKPFVTVIVILGFGIWFIIIEKFIVWKGMSMKKVLWKAMEEYFSLELGLIL